MAPQVLIHPKIIEEMLGHARSKPSLECCGLLAGSAGVITRIFPASNALASATAYQIAPLESFRLFRQIREEGLDHLGLYHSHPASDNIPSPTDIAQAYYPEQAYFIISLVGGIARPVRAFFIRDGCVEEAWIKTVV
jgi:[CysO sulfur-carrier protein]-S-L-cysteine hydrolase